MITSRTTTWELARSTPLFSAVGEAVMSRLMRGALVQVLPKGAVLFEEGAEANFVHLILSGSVGLTASAGKPDSTVVEIFRDGELFVAPAAILELPYLVSAVVLADSRILFLPADNFRAALDAEPKLARAMVNVLARHWRLLVEQIKDLKLRQAAERLAAFLVAQAEAAGGPAAAAAGKPVGKEGAAPGAPAGSASGGASTIALREPRNMLAARLGMTPESLSRAFAQLEAEGVVSEGRAVHIADLARLRRYCGLEG